jgi:hypothetical protein
MSTAETSFPAVIPSPTRLPPEVGSTLTALWLSIASGVLALVALWPMALESAPALFPDASPRDLAAFGWMVLASFAGFLLVFGLFLTWRVARRSRFALRTLQMSLVVGMLAGLALMVGIVILILQGKQAAPLGPAPVLCGSFLVLAALLPFCFGIFALSYSGTSAVEEFLRAPPETEPSYAVTASGQGGEEVMVTEAAEEAATPSGIGPTEATSQVAVTVRGRETMLAPAEGGDKTTMLQPMSEGAPPTMLAPQPLPEAPASAAQEPISPDELDRLFEEKEEDSSKQEQTGGGTATAEATYSDSIFDEDEFSGGRARGESGVSQSGLLREAKQLSTGESSIFSELNPLPQDSQAISGIPKESSGTGLSFTDSGSQLKKPRPEEEEPPK